MKEFMVGNTRYFASSVPHWTVTENGTVRCKGMSGAVRDGKLIICPNGREWSWGRVPEDIMEFLAKRASK